MVIRFIFSDLQQKRKLFVPQGKEIKEVYEYSILEAFGF
jgi:hypothetical protein